MTCHHMIAVFLIFHIDFYGKAELQREKEKQRDPTFPSVRNDWSCADMQQGNSSRLPGLPCEHRGLTTWVSFHRFPRPKARSLTGTGAAATYAHAYTECQHR